MARKLRGSFYYEGERYWASGKDEIELAINLDRLQRDVEQGRIGISRNMTVERWGLEWAETYKKPKVKEKRYKTILRFLAIINQDIGSMRLKDVKDIHLQKILNKRANKSYSDTKQLADVIKAVFAKAYHTQLILRDPAGDLELPQCPKGERRSLTDWERDCFLRAAADHPSGLLFKVMLYCGLRPGEACALDGRHLLLDERKIKVEQALESGTQKIGKPKTDAGIRLVPIPNEIYEELAALHTAPFEPVFRQVTTGRRHTETSRQKAWHSLKNQMDILMGAKFEKRKAKDGKMRMTKVLSMVDPELTPYYLRHTYCTDLQRAGVPLNVASYLMGHATIQVTAKIYTHTGTADIDAAAALINAHHGDNGGDAEKGKGEESAS